jgi:hypothetical protein
MKTIMDFKVPIEHFCSLVARVQVGSETDAGSQTDLSHTTSSFALRKQSPRNSI